MSIFTYGDRVKYSAEGLQVFPTYGRERKPSVERRGMVVTGTGRRPITQGCERVLWAKRKAKETMAASFIELAED